MKWSDKSFTLYYQLNILNVFLHFKHIKYLTKVWWMVDFIMYIPNRIYCYSFAFLVSEHSLMVYYEKNRFHLWLLFLCFLAALRVCRDYVINTTEPLTAFTNWYVKSFFVENRFDFFQTCKIVCCSGKGPPNPWNSTSGLPTACCVTSCSRSTTTPSQTQRNSTTTSRSLPRCTERRPSTWWLRSLMRWRWWKTTPSWI